LGDIVKDNPNAVEPATGGKEARLTIYEAEKGNDFGVSLKIATGVLKQDFKQVINSTSVDDKTGNVISQRESVSSLKDSLAFVGFGVATHWNKWTAEVYAQESTRGQTHEVKKDNYEDSSFRTSDYSVAVGYEPLKNLSISAGYKLTRLARNSREAISISLPNKESILRPELTGLQEFTTYGPSIGIAYNLRLNEDMSIAASVAYGWLKGERKVVTDESAVPQPTQGVSLGISFNHRIPRTHVKYSISLDHYQYSMEGKLVSKVPGTAFTDTDIYNIEQALDTFRATLIYEF